jgi:hypothetical protein
VRQQLKDSYSETGRPSIDLELLLRILLIGYVYGISSDASWWKNCACIWRGGGLGFDQEILHHSTFSKNRHGRFQESKMFERLFEQIVGNAWKWDWRKASTCRSMAPSWEPSSQGKPHSTRAVDGGSPGASQSLYLSLWPSTELRWSVSSQPRLQLHRNAELMWSMLAKALVHQCSFPVSDHPPVRTLTRGFVT